MHHVRRRDLFRGGGSVLATSLVSSALTREASAQAKTPRLVVFFSPNGTVHEQWRPSGSETSFAFRPGSILEPLQAVRDQVVICDGIDFVGVENHEAGMAAMLTGGGTLQGESRGMSIDQYVASKIGQDTRLPSLELGVETSAWGENVQTRMSYAAPGKFVSPEDRPLGAFQRMFGSATSDSSANAKEIKRKQSILDVVRGELAAFQKRLGARESSKLDQHLESIRAIESSLQKGIASCSASAPPDLDTTRYDNMPAIGKAQMDLLVLALACGVTRVASLQWAHTVAPHVLGWLGATDSHHSLSHSENGNTGGIAQFVQCERWFCEQFVYLLGALRTAQDENGAPLLDSTVVLWAKELGDARLHDCKSVPFVLAGGKAFGTGRYLNFQGAPHQRLLVSVCQALGLSNDSFGDDTIARGPLAGL